MFMPFLRREMPRSLERRRSLGLPSRADNDLGVKAQEKRQPCAMGVELGRHRSWFPPLFAAPRVRRADTTGHSKAVLHGALPIAAMPVLVSKQCTGIVFVYGNASARLNAIRWYILRTRTRYIRVELLHGTHSMRCNQQTKASIGRGYAAPFRMIQTKGTTFAYSHLVRT